MSQPLSLPPEVRRAQILHRIQCAGSASVTELARGYAVSPVTVHRDLETLARDGLVARIHGGARALHDGPRDVTDYANRLRQAWPAKVQIAAYARDEIEDGSIIFVDHSTSCLALGKQLERRPPRALTVVTNSPAIALELHANSVHVVVTPGEVDQDMRMITGGWADEFIGRLSFACAFVSAAGLTVARGLTTTRPSLAATLNAARAVSQRTIALIDSSKFGCNSLLTIAPAQDVDLIVTDDGLPAGATEAYRAAGIRLAVAAPVPDQARLEPLGRRRIQRS